jgi:hypothetical protein
MKAAAAYLGIHLWTLREAVRLGQIKYKTIGKSRGFYFDVLELDRFFDASQAA